MSERILVVGEALVDIVHRWDGTVDEHPGGSPLNVAIGLSRLGHPVEYAARFGGDARGEAIRRHLAREHLITFTPGTDGADRTSTATARLDADGGATYDFDLVWDVGEALDARPVGHLHTGSIAATLRPGADAVLAAARRTRRTGTVSYDPNARPTIMGEPAAVLPQVETFLGLADVVKASDEDIAWLYPGLRLDDVVDRWAGLGPSLVVLTRGRRGSLAVLAATGERVALPAGATTVVDTVGAGDSFMAGLVSGLLDGGLLGGPRQREALRRARVEEVRPALDRAGECAAITVSRPGADPPTRAEVVR